MFDLDLPRLGAVSFTLPWVFLLLPLPYAVVRWLGSYEAQGEALRVPFFARLTRMLGAAQERHERTRSRLRLAGLCLLWLLVLTALAGPQELGAPVTRTRSARDLLLAVDLSGSMGGTDLSTPGGPPATRLDVVKKVVGDFVRSRAGDRLGLVVFGDAPFVQVPFTTDTRVVEKLLDETDVGMAGPRTALGDAVGLSLRVLEKSRAKSRVVIVLTDGNDTGSQVAPLRAARIAQERGVKLYLIGVGDPKVAGEESLNEDVLRGMAGLTGGRYLHAQDPAELSAAYRELAQLEPVISSTDSYQPKRSIAYLPLFGIVALLSLQMARDLLRALLRGLKRAGTTRVQAMSELSAFHFLRPGLLYWLVPSALYALHLLLRAAAPSPWAPAVSPQLLPHLLGRSTARKWFGPESVMLGAAVLATLAAAGPSFAARSDASDPKDSALIVVFELSRSMSRHDVSPSRAERARLTLLDLVRQRPESPTALVVVAGSAHVLMPFTDDTSALEPSIKALAPELMPFDGQAFERAARRVSELARERKTPPAVLLVSDGLPPGGVDAFARLSRDGLGLVILSVGHDDDSLERLAARTDAEQVALSFGARDTGHLLAAIAQTRAQRLAPGDARFWRDDGPWLALPLAITIALWFRRGWVLGPVGLGMLALFSSGCAPALEHIWLTPDQQGRLSFERGDYLAAATRFEDPLWKGLSFYAAEKWDAAAQSFVSVEGSFGRFCLGNAYAQGGKLESALEVYDRALHATPTDRRLRKNRDKIRELLRSLQEDTDLESAKKEEQDHGDRAAALAPDQLAKPPTDQPQPSAAAQTAGQDPIEERVWLSRLTTDPSEFLRRKLALQAARGEPR